MALAQLDSVRKAFDRVRDAANGGDGELLTRYRTRRDQDAFGSLVRRHGPMVLGVCRRVLRDAHAADDAFQATFLVLAKRADAVRPPDRLAPWLYGVAYRTALKARGRAFRRTRVERAYAAEVSNRPPAASEEAADLLPVIDEQLNALPEKYRTPLVLCALQGLNKAEAAACLGLPEGTVSSRLARAREMLRDRLTRRGVVVPGAALAVLCTAGALQAAVPPALAASAAGVASGSALVPATVLTLSHEVLRSMTLLKLKTLCVAALSVALAGGGFGLYAIQADDKKPAQQGEKPKPPTKPGEKPNPNEKNGDNNQNGKNEQNGNNNQNGEGNKPKPDGEKPGVKKPEKPAAKFAGRVVSVDPQANTLTLTVKGDGGATEKVVKLAAGVKVFVDGKEAKLADVPKGGVAALVSVGTKDGVPPEVTEVRVTGMSVPGIVKQVDATMIALEGEKNPRTAAISAGTQVTVNGKAAKATDLKPGDKVMVVLSADEKTALAITSGAKPGDGEKPGVKNPKFGGKIASVDATAKTITVLTGKGDSVKETVLKLTADAKITVDGKDAKIGDLAKGAFATFALVATKDGQPREANAVTVTGATFTGVIKQVDATGVTIGGEKSDRVVKLATGGKVLIGEKEGKLADLKAGDKVTVTLTSDESGAVQIQSGVKKPTGDKPKPEKEEGE